MLYRFLDRGMRVEAVACGVISTAKEKTRTARLTLQHIDVVELHPRKGSLHSVEDVLQPGSASNLSHTQAESGLTLRLRPFWLTIPLRSGSAYFLWASGSSREMNGSPILRERCQSAGL